MIAAAPSRFYTYIIDGTPFVYNLESSEPLVIPNSVKEIGQAFLYECKKLVKPPIIPDSVTHIGDHFLMGCDGLIKAPRIPLSVTMIGDHFLERCYRLKEPPFIPISVTSVGYCFLYRCSTVIDIIIVWRVSHSVKGCREYWKRKSLVRSRVLTGILDLPLHLLELE